MSISNPIHRLEFTKRIADPVHGLIRLTDVESRVLTHPIFQRLRNITQLGIAEYVFPGARHNRFTHSLGVLNNVTLMYDAAYRNWKREAHLGNTGADIDHGELFSPDLLQKARLAAMCHDLGHFPFSHNLEEAFLWLERKKVMGSSFTHEVLSRRIVGALLGDILGDMAVDVGDMITGQSEEMYMQFPTSLVSGAIDADRMDYLVRDALHCGVRHGEFDKERLLDSVIPYQTTVGSREGAILAFKNRGIDAIEQFLLARHRMHQTIYFNPSVIGFEAAIRRAYYRLSCNDSPWPLPDEFMRDPELLISYDEIEFIHLMRHELRERGSWLIHPIGNRTPLSKIGPLYKTEMRGEGGEHIFDNIKAEVEVPEDDWQDQDHWMYAEHKSQTILQPVKRNGDQLVLDDVKQLKNSILLVSAGGKLLDPTRISGDGQHTFLPLIINHTFHRLIFFSQKKDCDRLHRTISPILGNHGIEK